MIWNGASNIDSDGFVIDLGKLKKISTSQDNKIVSVEPGLLMVEVYNFLDPLNITIPVGRAADVAVGGFLLGGGISFFTSTTGLANNHILNYEVVLADGSIVNVNANSEPELYYALKMGSTNYGIVTRFDMTAFELPLNTICAGVHGYTIDKLKDVSEVLVEFLDQTPQTPSLFAAGAGWDPTYKAYGALHGYTHSCAPGKDRLFNWVKSKFSEIGEFADGGPAAWSGLGDVTNTMRDILFPGGKRESWQTITFQKADASFIVDVFNLMKTAFEPLHAEGIRDIFTIQPFTSDQFLSGQPAQGNPSTSSFESEHGGLIVFLLIAEWEDPSKDALAERVARDLFSKIEALAQKRGLLHPWIYLNYADSYQPVYQRSVNKKTMGALANVKGRYDPKNIFTKYWRGGYKISQEDMTGDSRPVDEL